MSETCLLLQTRRYITAVQFVSARETDGGMYRVIQVRRFSRIVESWWKKILPVRFQFLANVFEKESLQQFVAGGMQIKDRILFNQSSLESQYLLELLSMVISGFCFFQHFINES